jgi:hypothetical protein
MKLFGAQSKNREKKWHARALLINPQKTKVVLAESSIRQREFHVSSRIYSRSFRDQSKQEIREGIDTPTDPRMNAASCFPKDGSVTVFNACVDGGK